MNKPAIDKSFDAETEEFLSLLEAHKGIVFKVAHSYSGNRHDRDDLIQEISYQLWRSRQNYNPQYALSTWVYRVALNVAISAYRKSQRRRITPLPEGVAIAVQDEGSVEANEQMQILDRLIGDLNDLNRALILLFLDGKSHQEMSEILGISKTNVGTRLARVRNQLKQKFATLDGELI